MTRILSLLLGLLLLAVACTGGDEVADVGDDETAAGQETAADEAQELVVGAGDDTYVQERTGANVGMYPLNTNIYETLTYLTPEYEVEPLLAESWEFIEPNTWRFHLREGVTFHNGEPMDAQAVKEGLFDRVAANGGGTIRAGEDSAVVVDEHTIDFTPLEDNRRVPEQIVHPNNSVVAPGTDITSEPVGTGPFQFVEYRPGEHITVERYDEYWGDQAELAGITFRFIPDDSSRMLALESGEIDLALQVPREDVASLEDAGVEIVTSPVGAYRALYANMHGEPPYDILQDVRVRKAVAHGINREELVEEVLAGLATTDQTMVPPGVLGEHADEVEGFSYDPEQARALLEEAGWVEGADGIRQKDGRPLSLTLVSGFGGADIHRPVPTYLQAQLAEIGIDIEIVERPDSASYQELIDAGEGDLFLEQGSQNDANAGFLPVLLFYTGGAGATAQYQSLFAPGEQFDELIAPSLTEPDAEVAREAVAAAMNELIDEQAAVIPLAGIYSIYAMDPAVEGLPAHPSTLNTRWDDVSLTE